MHRRDNILHINDIHKSLSRIIDYKQGMDREMFFADRRTYDAVMWNFEVVFEAVKRAPDEIREMLQDIVWKRVLDFGGEVISKYYSLDDEIAWDAIENDVPKLKAQIESKFSNLL